MFNEFDMDIHGPKSTSLKKLMNKNAKKPDIPKSKSTNKYWKVRRSPKGPMTQKQLERDMKLLLDAFDRGA